jgi:hypothetical protein
MGVSGERPGEKLSDTSLEWPGAEMGGKLCDARMPVQCRALLLPTGSIRSHHRLGWLAQ